MKLVKRISIILLILLLSFCSDQKKIATELLAKAYVDILVVEDFYAGTDSIAIKKSEIFQKYSITENEYLSSFEQFGNNREEWDNFFNLANSYLDTLKSEIKNEKLKTRP